MDFEKPRLIKEELVREEAGVIVRRTYAAYSPLVGQDCFFVASFTEKLMAEPGFAEFEASRLQPLLQHEWNRLGTVS